MARLQILELPSGINDERPPFLLVIDQADDAFRHELGDPNATMRDAQADLAKELGARAVLVFRQPVDIPANDALPLPLLSTEADDGNAIDPGLADLVFRTLGIELAPGGIPYEEALHNACRQLEKSEAAREHLQQGRDEARKWARHGYEIGQKHCGWTDHGIAPDWLTEGWPPAFDSCEHLKQAAAAESRLTEFVGDTDRNRRDREASLLDALGMDHIRDWDDILNAARGLRKDRDTQTETLERVRNLPTEPEVMNAQQEHPNVWRHGYHCGVLAAKAAARPRDEPTVKP